MRTYDNDPDDISQRSQKRRRLGLLRKKDKGQPVTDGSRDPLPKRQQGESFLLEETWAMDRKRRAMEQDGHRKLARVHAKERSENEANNSPEGELQNNIRQHPWLDSQRFDGVDPGLNPEPPLNTDARREFDNERREQEMEKQLRLGNMPKMNSAPKPRPQ